MWHFIGIILFLWGVTSLIKGAVREGVEEAHKNRGDY